MTYVVAIHDVSDPERFWGGAAESLASLPQGVALRATFPQEGGAKAVCLWEADSVDAVRQVVDSAAGDTSRNEYFEVDSRHPGTRGLPEKSTASA